MTGSVTLPHPYFYLSKFPRTLTPIAVLALRTVLLRKEPQRRKGETPKTHRSWIGTSSGPQGLHKAPRGLLTTQLQYDTRAVIQLNNDFAIAIHPDLADRDGGGWVVGNIPSSLWEASPLRSWWWRSAGARSPSLAVFISSLARYRCSLAGIITKAYLNALKDCCCGCELPLVDRSNSITLRCHFTMQSTKEHLFFRLLVWDQMPTTNSPPFMRTTRRVII